ncbi:MAG: SDR family NAD(P)-dependent oxidoreductase [Leptospirales bacterium]
MIKSVLITGANAGLGKECARQMALLPTTQRVYLACRNETKAKEAKASLEESTGRSIFEIIILDTSDLSSVKSAVQSLKEPVDGLVLNAGGMGGKEFANLSKEGVIHQVAVNVLGNVFLLEEILKTKKLTKVAMYAGSEAARGVSKMGMKQPDLKTSSVEEFISVCNGTFFGDKIDGMATYGYTKYLGALYMSSLARKHPNIRLVTMSPGGTSGTNVMQDAPTAMKIMLKVMMALRLTTLLGLFHKLELGAKRYVNALNDDSFKSGIFYGSKKPVLVGPVIDQATIFEDLNNAEFQDNAYKAVQSFLP